MIRFIVVALFVGLFLVLSIPIMIVEWIIGKFNMDVKSKSSLAIVNWAFRVVRVLSGTKVIIKGLENVPTDTAVLYVGNHRSFYDIILTYPKVPRPTGYVAKREMLKVSLLSVWMKYLHCLFLDRENVKEGLKTILEAVEKAKSGISICIFPEGTRNKDAEHPDTLLPFKEGSFKIAQKTKCPIVPMVLTGTADVFENHFPWVKSTKVTLTYGKPIYVSELSKENQKRLGSYCEKIIQDMLNQELASQTK